MCSCVSVFPYVRPLPRHGQLFWGGGRQLLVRAGSQWWRSSRPGQRSSSGLNLLKYISSILLWRVHSDIDALCCRIFTMKTTRSGSPRKPGGKWSEPLLWPELVASSCLHWLWCLAIIDWDELKTRVFLFSHSNRFHRRPTFLSFLFCFLFHSNRTSSRSLWPCWKGSRYQMRWDAARTTAILFILIDTQENILNVQTNRVVKLRQRTASFPIHPQGVSQSVIRPLVSQPWNILVVKLPLGQEKIIRIDSLDGVLLLLLLTTGDLPVENKSLPQQMCNAALLLPRRSCVYDSYGQNGIITA